MVWQGHLQIRNSPLVIDLFTAKYKTISDIFPSLEPLWEIPLIDSSKNTLERNIFFTTYKWSPLTNYRGFNHLSELSNPNEKFAYKGNSTRYTKFKFFINTNGLIDIAHVGVPLDRIISEKQQMLLDRALANVH